MDFTFRAFAEDAPGEKWQRQFKSLWPSYKRWFLRYGERDRPTYHESAQALRRYMPEFEPIYDAMVELAGGGDHAARFLAQYCPPPLFRGCSQAIYDVEQSVLVRSYDYSPYVFDGLLMRSRFAERQVIAMLDCMSGVLDGINDDGLAVSMSFGGREEFGEGFSVSLLLRYLLEFAGDVKEACELIRPIPVQGAYNIMLLDREANHQTLKCLPMSAFSTCKMSSRTANTRHGHLPVNSCSFRFTTVALRAASARFTTLPFTLKAGPASISGLTISGNSASKTSSTASTTLLLSIPMVIPRTAKPIARSTPASHCPCCSSERAERQSTRGIRNECHGL
jgi:hypothetical protein